ncbi:hypothetical protein [uncultured Methanobrevibacter sp.]|uniref:hypothetical protein n=1 Tax=uncultured Methanobrevibacter sp. TaxID=253161 RepID=UPI0025EA1F02|nr:hypothetical protein [uncultured Methanobrevibacter sp.]
MSEFDDLFGDEFFIIDSKNISAVESKFYGYAVIDEKIVIGRDNTDINYKSLNGIGAYIFINVEDEKISIYQDSNGSYGIYIYQREDYFAISNSFFKLSEYLKNNDISLNEDYAKSFLFCRLCSYDYGGTLINEIQLVPRNYIIYINKFNNKISFEKIKYNLYSVSLDSQEGINLLDEWYYKWINLIRSIRRKTNNISIELSGGFDTRIVSVLWLNANIDLTNIRIKSFDDKKHIHEEDFKIASQIAKEFDFQLNQPIFYDKYYFKDSFTPIDISFYLKGGFHKQMYFKEFKTTQPIYSITGSGGGCIRGYPNKTPDKYLEDMSKFCFRHDSSLRDSTFSVIENSFNKIKEDFEVSDNSKEITMIHHNEVRTRHHFAKAIVESYFSNICTLNPLLDPNLHKIKINTPDCNDDSLLIALIFSRYCPKLLDFEFQGGREISNQTIEYAKKINDKYPLSKNELDYISGPHETKVHCISINQDLQHEEILKKVFYSPKFKSDFLNYFSYESYWKVANSIETLNFHHLTNAYAAISIIKIINDIKNENKFDLNELIDLYINDYDLNNDIPNKIINSLLKYNTARIDIKNVGDHFNSVDIINYNDASLELFYPNFLKNEKGKGLIVRSMNSYLDLNLYCIGDGELNLRFRSNEFKDVNNERFPVYIDFTKVRINNEDYLDDPILVSFDKPFVIKKDVKNQEVIKIHIEWKPFTESSIYTNNEKLLKEKNKHIKQKNNNLNKENIELRKTVSKLKKENGRIKRKNNNLSQNYDSLINSKSWKLTKPLRSLKGIFN